MAASSANLHEDEGRLQKETIDRHRAIVSIMEELEAVDWYDQRVDAAGDEELRAILAHNRDEEKEHAVMTLEWLRRRDPALDQQLRAYLFTEGSIIGREAALDAAEAGGEQGEGAGATAEEGSLGIGSLKKEGRP